MKILHIPFGYYPDAVGGTEVYVAGLCAELQLLNVEVVIAAPDTKTTQYLYNGIRIHRYEISQGARNIRVNYGQDDLLALCNLGKVLEAEVPDIVHIHAFTSGFPLSILSELRKIGVRTVFTYHTPTASCTRGTLLKWGNEVCNGSLNAMLCTQCTLTNLGLNRLTSRILASVPVSVGLFLGNATLQGGPWTALRMHELVTLRHRSFQSLMQQVDSVIVLCKWSMDLLRINMVPKTKISLIRHGLSSWDTTTTIMNTRFPVRTLLRIVYVGRIDPTKGLHLLLHVLHEMPLAQIELDIYGVFQSENDSYTLKVRQLAESDSRVRLLPPILNGNVVSMLRDYDLLVVPSLWLETGPLVILEAFAAGIPVIGSNLGGISELVSHGVNGILVPSSSTADWRNALQDLVDSPEMVSKLRGGVQPPRKMSQVARETLDVYISLLSGTSVAEQGSEAGKRREHNN